MTAPPKRPLYASVNKQNRPFDPYAIRNMQRQLCRTDIYALAKVLGYPDISPEVHGPIVEILPKLYGGQDIEVSPGVFEYKPYKEIWQMPGNREFLVLYPRGHLKTTLVSQTYLVQCIINWPDIRIMLSCGTGDQVERVIRAVKGIFQYNEDFRILFPEFCPENIDDFGSSQQFIVPARKLQRGEPTVFSVTVGKTISGYHPDIIFHSDLVDKTNVKTPGGITDVKNHFIYMQPLLERYSAKDGYPATRGFTFVEGTPYDFGDLHNELIENDQCFNCGSKKTDHVGKHKCKDYKPLWVKVVRPAQEDYPYGKILWEARFPPESLEQIRVAMDDWHFCTPKETPILMNDLSFRMIADIKPGDVVIGWDDTKKKPKLQASKVLECGSLVGLVNNLKMESGRTVSCTPNHYWFTGRREIKTRTASHRRYAQAGLGYHDLKSLCFVLDPQEQNWNSPISAYYAGCLAGLFDGEGSASSGSMISFCQSNGKNKVVCQRIRESLKFYKFEWHETVDRRNSNQERIIFSLHGGLPEAFRFLRITKPARSQEIVNRLIRNSSAFVDYKDKIVSISPRGYERVYWLTTETGNYVAWGYASKNSSQYLMKCVPQGDGLCDPRDVLFIPREHLGSIIPTLRLHSTIDLAGMEESSRTDFTVITLGGFDHDGRLYIIEIHCGHYTPEQVIEIIFDLHNRWPTIIDFKIEKDAHARVLLPFLQRENSKRGSLTGKWLPAFIPIKRDTRVTKQERIKGLRPWFKATPPIIRFNGSISLGTQQELLSEIAKFPSQSYGIHDDILDTLADLMQNSEGTVTSDVIADPPDMKFALFGKRPPRDRFLGFDEEGVAEWLYGPDPGRSKKESKTGFLN